MVKNQEKPIKEIQNWLSDLDIDSIEKSAKLDIKPQLKIEVDNEVMVKINSLPEKTLFADGNEYFTMNIEKNDLEYQFVCEAKSFRYQLAVLAKKIGGMDKLIGKQIIISKIKGNTKDRKNVELYNIFLK